MSDDPMEFLAQHKAKMVQMQAAAVAAEESAATVALMHERMRRIDDLANQPYKPPEGGCVLCQVCWDCPCACKNRSAPQQQAVAPRHTMQAPRTQHANTSMGSALHTQSGPPLSLIHISEPTRPY
eukprot:TRINITY_DN5235_c0_g1_i4.p2 TRINITY_DN5235_c0_g1~~TRINITY_DN5235_c0_g1_i4.p2  ORF type:complete len:125 (-),score=24.14 TRINITY_DN5235_c0_g1_i4:53-427(-)